MKNKLLLLFVIGTFVLKAQHSSINQKSALYTIPVVFHVLHQNGYENISFAQIEDAVRILNENYSATNASVASIHSDFQGMQANAQIEFKLAKIAPNGKCFNGVTRTNTPLAKMNGLFDKKIQAMINSNDVFQGIWPETQYLNIFVCYADSAEATSSNITGENGMLHNSIFVLDSYCGSIGTGSYMSTKEFPTTEVGRWLGLHYTFGPKTFGQDPNSCNTDDGLADTPNCIWNYACFIEDSTCGSRAMTENFMALSYCMKFFTNEQVGVMHATLNNPANSRYALWQASNLLATGVNNSAQLCQANFTNSDPIICYSNGVQFKDASYSNPQSWLWNFPGGTPASSTEQNPLIYYSSPGLHDVTLTVSDGLDTLTITKSNLVQVTAANGTDVTYYEGFETMSYLDNGGQFFVYNPDSNAHFAITNWVAHSGNQCAILHNYEDTLLSLDALVSSKINFSWLESTVTPATMSFRYAFKRRENDIIGSFKVYKNANCYNWSQVKDLTNDLKAATPVSEDWYPSINDWQTVHITNLLLSSANQDFRYKFEFLAQGTNNLFIDDINIYKGTPSDEIVLSTNDLSNSSISALQLFPNPSSANFNISFNITTQESVIIGITDITGNVIQSNTIMANEGENIVMMDLATQSKGLYFVTLTSSAAKQTLQFVLK